MRTAQVPALDSALARDCEEVPELTGDSVDDLIETHLELIKRYQDCASKHKATVHAWQGLRGEINE